MGIFKAYDIRGTYPDQINEATAERIGRATAVHLGAKTLVVGRDVRLSSPEVAAAVARGMTSAGCDVVDIGRVTTPMSYFAIAKYGYDGAVMVTASHNPPQYTGFKISREKSIPLSESTGLQNIKELVDADRPVKPARPGTVRAQDIRAAYVEHVRGFLRTPRPLKMVVDTANGCVGMFFHDVVHGLPFQIVPLCFEPDGNFPNHEPNPSKDENVVHLRERIRAEKAQLGVAFDGDGDRCLFFDENGDRIPTDMVTILLARDFLRRSPGSAVVYDLRSSWAVPEEIRRAGGVPIRERVGHSFMKATLRKHDGVFGGELAGHYYFRDHAYADSGLITFACMLNVVSESAGPASELTRAFQRYHATGEINFHIEDKDAKIAELKRTFADGRADELDGITVEYDDWWFNVRKSNTEPLLRLNLEARTAEKLKEARNKMFAILGKPE